MTNIAKDYLNGFNDWVFVLKMDDDVLRVIRTSAIALVKMKLGYTKITTGETKEYIVAPYSFRTEKVRDGVRQMLYAYDFEDGKIKKFAAVNIRVAELLPDEHFKPMWEVEIAAPPSRQKKLKKSLVDDFEGFPSE